MTTPATTARPRAGTLDGDVALTVRPCDRHDIAELIGVTDEDVWPILPLDPPPAGSAALPDADGTNALVLLALDAAGRCLGIASYDRTGEAASASFALDVSRVGNGRGVAAALVRRLTEEAARHGIAELRGWVSPAQARELLAAAAPVDRYLLSMAGDRWLLVERTHEGGRRT